VPSAGPPALGTPYQLPLTAVTHAYRKLTKHCHIGSADVRLYLSGYGDDPQERFLRWLETPSAIVIFKRWCELGGLTALSIMSPITKTPFDCPDAAEKGMPADLVWAISQGITPGSTIKRVDFLEALDASDRYCDEHYIGSDHRSVSPFEKAGQA
jgi:hypothetical protein